MSVYDFTTQPNRAHQQAAKWRPLEKDKTLLPLGIADMDFLPLPTVQAALLTYAKEHVFGYSYPSQQFYQSIIQWEKNQHHLEVTADSLVVMAGVVPGITIALQAFTEKGDAVLIHTPSYPPFARTIKLNERELVRQSLVNLDGRFELDLEAFEQVIIEKKVKLYLLCNPHNPGGRIWSRGELEAIGRICQKHGVLVVSDEIHQDFALFGNRHQTFHGVAEEFADFSIVLSSATKTFNLAGTKTSFAIIPNSQLRKAFVRQQEANYQQEVATVGLLATQVAYQTGQDWLTELKSVLEKNIETAITYLEEHTRIKAMKPEATYLIWLDFSAYGMSHEEIQKKLLQEAHVHLNDGLVFGADGRHHARLNAAAPLVVIEEACRRIANAFGQ